jgi:hypothetical protein
MAGKKRMQKTRKTEITLIPGRNPDGSSRYNEIRIPDAVKPGDAGVKPGVAIESLRNIPKSVPPSYAIGITFPGNGCGNIERSYRGVPSASPENRLPLFRRRFLRGRDGRSFDYRHFAPGRFIRGRFFEGNGNRRRFRNRWFRDRLFKDRRLGSRRFGSRWRLNRRYRGGRFPGGFFTLSAEYEKPQAETRENEQYPGNDERGPGESVPVLFFLYGNGFFIEPPRGWFMGIKFKIGKFRFPVILVYGLERHAQVLMVRVGRRIQIYSVRGDFAPGIGGYDHLHRRFSLRPRLNILNHNTAYVKRVGHGPGKTLIEIDLHTALAVVNRGKDQSPFNIRIFFEYGIEFPVGEFYANSRSH